MKVFLLLVASAILFSGHLAGAAVAPTDPAVLQAQKWDIPIVVGPGGYRGEKKLKISKKVQQTIAPGAFLDGVKADGTNDALWSIDGAYLKECEFSGDLGSRFSAKDTAFEDCRFRKDGAWWVGWASTRWKFENCIITKSFVNGGGLHDYAVYAKECTFVGVEMKKLGLKDDPSKYYGKDDNAFIRCRFIACEIPESVLALSVDCVFENCKFDLKQDKPGKGKDVWESASAPVKVNAYVAGGTVPAPFIHGKLSVVFAQSGMKQVAGAKLPFTHAGGRILVPWTKQISKMHPVGSLDKAASEIPVFTAAVNDKPAPSPAPTPQPQPPKPVAQPVQEVSPMQPPKPPGGIVGPRSFLNIPGGDPVPVSPPAPPAVPIPSKPLPPAPPAQPAARDVRSIEEVLAGVPLSLKISTAGKINPVALEDLNRTLDQRNAGKAAALRLVVEDIVGYRDDGYAFLVNSQGVPVRINGEPCTAIVKARFRANQSASLGKLTKGATLNVKGTITNAEVSFVDRGLRLQVTLDESQSQ
jgi:hypothetical protein